MADAAAVTAATTLAGGPPVGTDEASPLPLPFVGAVDDNAAIDGRNK